MNSQAPLLNVEFLDYSRLTCAHDGLALHHEWLVTNGIGGYASGTLAGALTRSYHGLLIAATTPPAVRTLLLAKLEESATYRDRTWRLGTNRWQDGSTDPVGHRELERFRLEGTIPTWTWNLTDALLEKRVFMLQGQNTTCVHYRLLRGSAPITISLAALVNRRSHHTTSPAGSFETLAEAAPHGARLHWVASASEPACDLWLQSDHAVPSLGGQWWNGFLLEREQERGCAAIDNHWHAATFELRLSPGQSALFTASTQPQEPRDADAALDAERRRQNAVVAQAPLAENRPMVRQLVLAADQCIVRRDTAPSVMAGYPWFADWSRDAMLAAPGLFLCTGRGAEGAAMLRMYAERIRGGLLPNRFPDRPGEPLEYNSVDAPLLFIRAVARFAQAGVDPALAADLLPACESILRAYTVGTEHGIRVDPVDGLVQAGADGLQLTWMDAKVDGLVVTPRRGKPIEVNAYWLDALEQVAHMAGALNRDAREWLTRAAQVRTSFARFWNPSRGCCFDVLDGPDGNDATIRPNQLLVTAMDQCPLTPGQRQRVVDVCTRRLWMPWGLRTLDPESPGYVGHYQGDQRSRDLSYHQGTAWPWLLGPLLRSHYQVHGDVQAIIDYITPCVLHLREAGIGGVSEVFDGDPPHTPGGCPVQAWSIAELLELTQMVSDAVRPS